MSRFSIWNPDAYSSSKNADCNTVGDAKWKGIQDRALKANPAMGDTFSDEADRLRILGRDNFDKREQN